jgi:hypothetical protein
MKIDVSPSILAPRLRYLRSRPHALIIATSNVALQEKYSAPLFQEETADGLGPGCVRPHRQDGAVTRERAVAGAFSGSLLNAQRSGAHFQQSRNIAVLGANSVSERSLSVKPWMGQVLFADKLERRDEEVSRVSNLSRRRFSQGEKRPALSERRERRRHAGEEQKLQSIEQRYPPFPPTRLMDDGRPSLRDWADGRKGSFVLALSSHDNLRDP